jgi:cytochrome bd-type quinol oxidase subunit 2
MRTDPTDTGGLFVGRRPGTRPVKYRDIPEYGDERRRRRDRRLAAAVLVLMTIIGVAFWGPIPAGALWVGSRFNYWTDSVILGLVTAFATMLLVLFLGLSAMKRLDQTWILMRRAAGYDQREGVIGRIFAISCAIGVVLFSIWLLIFAGLGPSIAPSG